MATAWRRRSRCWKPGQSGRRAWSTSTRLTSVPRGPGGVSAQDLVGRLAAAAVPTIVWYGLATPADPLEVFHDVTTAAPEARAWCAELHVAGPRANLAGIGPGCGILLAGVAPTPATRQAAEAFVAAFNDLAADTDLQVSVEPVFATSA